MNGANQPIVESPDEALEFFFRFQEINCLILANFLMCRSNVSDIISDDHSRARLACLGGRGLEQQARLQALMRMEVDPVLSLGLRRNMKPDLMIVP